MKYMQLSTIYTMFKTHRHRVEKNPVHLKKKQPTRVFLKTCFFKETKFCSFLRKTDKPYSELFLFHHAISLFSELQNNNLLNL